MKISLQSTGCSYNLESVFYNSSVFDSGHMSYLGTLMMELTHNHPVMRVFCQHLVMDIHKMCSVTAKGDAKDDSKGNCNKALTAKGMILTLVLQG